MQLITITELDGIFRFWIYTALSCNFPKYCSLAEVGDWLLEDNQRYPLVTYILVTCAVSPPKLCWNPLILYFAVKVSLLVLMIYTEGKTAQSYF